MDSPVETHSYNAKVVRVPNLSTLVYLVLDYILTPLRFWTRGRHAARVSTISAAGGSYLWLTNHDQFNHDLRAFIDAVWLESPDQLEHGGVPRAPRACLYRGVQFNTTSSGRLFRVHTYLAGSVRYGGFDEYPLK